MNIKKRYVVPTILAGILTGFMLTNPNHEAKAAIYVTDVQNIAENAKTAINTYTNAVNTAKQVSLMVQNLTSMDPKALIAHYTGLDKEYKRLMEDLDSQVGTLEHCFCYTATTFNNNFSFFADMSKSYTEETAKEDDL